MKLKYNFYIQLMINFLSNYGISIDEVYSKIGIHKNCEKPQEHELSIENIHNLTIFTKEYTGIDHCGLEIIKNVNLNDYGFLGPYASSCPQLKDAIFRISETQKKINPLITYELLPANNPSSFVYNLDKRWEIQYPESAKEIIEFAIANGVITSRILTQKKIVPLSVGFKHNKPNDISVYTEIFKCPIYFDQGINSAKYPDKIMSYKITTYNPHLLKILDDFIEYNFPKRQSGEDLILDTKRLLMKGLRYKIPLEEEIAEQLNVSKYYLQKKLKTNGTSFSQLLGEIKRELSIAYLESNEMSIKEIAWLLGYKDVSNFYRAFKRWTNKAPGEFLPKN